MISDKQSMSSFSSVCTGSVLFAIFLSILSGHLTLLWYYPLWSMSFTGCEVSLVVLPLSAIMMNNLRLRKLWWIAASLLGLYVPSNIPIFGIKLLALPVGARLLSSAAGLFLATSLIFDTQGSGYEWPLGILIFNCIKYGYIGNIPVWPIINQGYSIFIFSLFILFASIQQDNVNDGTKYNEYSSIWSLKLCSWMYLIDNLMSESASIQLWSAGDTFEGNRILMSEIITIGGQVFSMLAAINGKRPGRLGLLGGTILSLLFYFASNNYIKLLGGLIMRSLMFSCLVQDAHEMTSQSRSTVAAGLVMYIVASILHMASTAYAFMPYGWIMRERAFVVFFPSIIVALFPHITKSSPTLPRRAKRLLLKTMSVIIGLSFGRRMYKLHLKPTSTFNTPLSTDSPTDISQLVRREFGGLPIVKVGIWAVHFGIDKNLYSSEHRMARLIEALDLDVIGLVESDLMRSVMGQRDLGRLIAASLPTRYYVDYGPSPRRHTWGCTMLSRFPINKSKHYLLPSPNGEIACAILANIQVAPDVSVNVLIAHNGQEEDKLDRQLQTDYLADLVRENKDLPLIYAGYLVAKPHSDLYHRLFKPTPGKPHNRAFSNGVLRDIDPDINDRWCLYIGHNQRFLKPIGFARVHHGGITDTELQVGSFAVMPAGKHVADFEQKWDLIVRQVKVTDTTSPLYYRRWLFEEPLSICPAGSNTVCEHYYHLKRQYF